MKASLEFPIHFLKIYRKQNAELKRLVGELTLDNRMLKDVLGKNW
jgi:hypothetical protein